MSSAAASEEESVHQGGFGLENCSAQQIHSTNFSVWECIIIIGVGGGVRAGGGLALYTIALDCFALYRFCLIQYQAVPSKT
jgi:hypothetical protein